MCELRSSPSIFLNLHSVLAISGSREGQARIRERAHFRPPSIPPSPHPQSLSLVCVCVSECLSVAKPDIRSTSVKAQVMDDYTELDPRT